VTHEEKLNMHSETATSTPVHSNVNYATR